LQASFDPTSLNFPNANLVTIVASDATTNTGSTLNWLVQTTAGAPAKLGFVTAPSSSAQAGVALAQQPSVQLLDGLGNEIYQSGITITAAVTTGGGTATFTAPVNTDAAGVGTFTNLTIGGAVAGTAQTLSFTFPGISLALTSVVQLTAGPANKLAITTQPSTSAQAGVVFGTQPVIAIQDQYGNQTSSTASVAAAIATGSPALAGTASLAAVNGVATFTNLEIDGAAGTRTLSFSSSGLTGVTSGNIAVGAGPASQLVITTQPSSTAQAGVPFATQPAVTIEDQFGNPVNSGAAVVASIITGAGTLAGGTSVAAVSGVASYTNLEIDGLVGVRALHFTSGALTSVASSSITVSAGSAASIQTFINSTAAQSYNYGTTLTAYTNVSPNPQVIVKDAYGNPVGNQTVYWAATTANGGVLTVGAAGSPTSASGTAVVSSWLIGEGVNQATAGLFAPGVTPTLPGYLDAQFSASTPTGISVFACAAGAATNKTDVAPMSIKTPNGSIRTVTLYMSVTGQASVLSSYPATIELFKGTATTGYNVAAAKVGSGSGTVELPGDNGKALPITFVLSDPALQSETNGTSVIWIKLTITAPGTRKPQVWYQNATFKPSDTCYNSLVYTTGYPSNTTFKRGLSINATN
jgi:hypothetical protein